MPTATPLPEPHRVIAENNPDNDASFAALRGRRWPALVLCAGLAYCALLHAMLAPGTFYSGDAGLKFMQVQQWSRGGPDCWRLDLVLPAEPWVRVAWERGLYPLIPPFVIPHDHKQYINYPPFFAWLCAPLYAALGFRGLYVIPMLATVAIWITFRNACRRAAIAPLYIGVGLVAVALASPLTFYGATFWEHTLGIALAFPAVARMILPKSRRLWIETATGLMLGLSAWLRPELLMLAVLIAALALFDRRRFPDWRPRIAFILAILVGLSGTFIYNLAVSGALLGFRGMQVQERSSFWLPNTATRVLGKTLRELLLTYPYILLALTWAVARGVAPTTRRAFWRNDAPLLLIAAIQTLALIVIFPNAGGNQWGPRYHLMLVPAAAMLVARWMNELTPTSALRRWLWLATAALLAVGVYQNVIGGTIHLAQAHGARIRPLLYKVRSSPFRVVATDDHFTAMELAVTLNDKRYFLADGTSELLRLARLAADQGERGLLLLALKNRAPPPSSLPLFDANGRSIRLRLRIILEGWVSVYEGRFELE